MHTKARSLTQFPWKLFLQTLISVLGFLPSKDLVKKRCRLTNKGVYIDGGKVDKTDAVVVGNLDVKFGISGLAMAENNALRNYK